MYGGSRFCVYGELGICDAMTFLWVVTACGDSDCMVGMVMVGIVIMVRPT